jgi:ferredoxin
MLKLPCDRIGELFQALASKGALYLPVEKGGQVNFAQWTPAATVRLDVLNTVKSAKDHFFPQTENIVSFRREGNAISIIEEKDASAPFTVMGVKGCDGRSLDILDSVFLSDPVDTFYKSRRENGVVVTTACAEPEETCFCSVFGIDASEPQGDVVTWIVDGTVYWDAKTPKGTELTNSVKSVFVEASPAEAASVGKQKESIKAQIAELPLGNLDLEGFDGEAQLEKFNSPLWKELSQACVGCGTCTFVCPTCQCYDIQDFNTGHGIQRFRCWDSCMFSDFTLMAHGNSRKSQVERFRQRFMHKLIYFPANNEGIYSCVGCGRCVAKCPMSLNIAKVIRALGVSVNV